MKLRLRVILSGLLVCALVSAASAQESQWARYQHPDRNSLTSAIILAAKPAEAGELSAACPNLDAAGFLRSFSAVLVHITTDRGHAFTRRPDNPELYLSLAEVRATVVGQAVVPAFRDPELTLKYGCLIDRFVRPASERPVEVTPSAPALVMLILPKIRGEASVSLPVRVVPIAGFFFSGAFTAIWRLEFPTD